jgi:hypothetical protein
MPSPDGGWTWLDGVPGLHGDEVRLILARQCARLFASADGEAVLQFLKDMTLARCLGPEAGDAALRHLEGQRHLVLQLLALAARGRDGV